MSEQDPVKKKRSVTSVALGWLAERLRKTEEIRAKVTSGTYKVNPEKVAQSIVDRN